MYNIGVAVIVLLIVMESDRIMKISVPHDRISICVYKTVSVIMEERFKATIPFLF